MGDDPTDPDCKADRLRILEFQVDQLRRELERLEKRHAEAIYSAAWHFAAPVRLVERAIRRMLATKGPLGFADGQMLALASCLTRHWPFVRQALEHYGEASAE